MFRVLRLLVRRPAPGPRASAGIATDLRVRAPWNLVHWWRRRGRAASPSSPVDAAAPDLTRPLSARHRPLSVRRRPLTAHRGGPEVTPGHDLIMRPPPMLPGSVHALAPSPGSDPSRAGISESFSRTGAAKSTLHRAAGLPGPGRYAAAGLSSMDPVALAGRPTLARGRAADGPTLRPGHQLTLRPPQSTPQPVPGAAPGQEAGGASPIELPVAAPAVRRSPARRPTASSRVEPGRGFAPVGRATVRLAGGGLVRRPGEGPTVHNPVPAEDMRVLGGGGLPPGNVPDPTGAVQLSPAVAQRPGPGTRPAPRGMDFAAPVQEKVSPRARWEAAVAARPLEAPRPLPNALHAMAAAITGRTRAPLFTTGPATRHALAAAGALGATTGTVVHLPAVPTAAPAVAAVLAHELTHTRNPVRRPRFLLGGMSGLLDDDERSALAAGADRLKAAPEAAAGIVDRLPVGGGIGAVGEVATRAARAAVLEATASPIASAAGWAQNARSTATEAMSTATGLVDGATDGLADGLAGATGAVTDAVGAATGAVGTAVNAVGNAASGLAGKAAAALDPDKVVEIVEARLLREIERRGGRWAGVF
ncbi:hypothetical protein Adi01nite_18890 [Amorphoplanes digitatis]|nr:hypothetical protein Adi01nite_18890 [Actinoplanes digitatis]